MLEGVIYLVNEKKYVGVLWVGKEDHISWYEDFASQALGLLVDT